MSEDNDRHVVGLIKQWLTADRPWLSRTFGRVKLINDRRRPSTPSEYTFEWAIQTSLGQYLLDGSNSDVSDVRVGQQDSETHRKYDIRFCAWGREIVIEIKTHTKCSFSYLKGDAVKPYPKQSLAYLLGISLPCPECKRVAVENAVLKHAAVTHDGFRWYLFSVQQRTSPS